MQTRSKTRKALVENPLVDHPSVSDSIPDDTLGGIQTRSRKCKAAENPLVYQPSVENVFLSRVQPVYHLPTVKNTLTNLPHHIIIDILLRLPTEYVSRCKNASKLLEILATTPLFIRTHRARQPTSIIALQSFSQSSDRELKLYFIDEHAKKVEEAKLKLDFCYTLKENPVMLYDSYDGFLLFRSKEFSTRSILVIWNPKTKQQVTITWEGSRFTVCGFYLNPHNKEYEVLLLHRDFRGGKYAFNILSFGSNTKIKLQENICIHSYMPRSERPPTIINGTLYWMVDRISSKFEDPELACSHSIMAFEIGTNKFSTTPGASCDNPGRRCYEHSRMQLIEVGGQLGLCLLSPDGCFLSDAKLVLWVLNPATNSWAKSHTMTLPRNYTSEYFSCWPNSLDVEVVKMKDGKLLVRQKNRLLLCDLDLNTHEIVEKKGFEDDSFRPVIHTQSLVSLNTDKLIELNSVRG